MKIVQKLPENAEKTVEKIPETESKAKKYTKVTCEQCNMEFYKNANIKEHIQIVHEKIWNFTWEICEKSFPRQGNLDQLPYLSVNHFFMKYLVSV